MVRRAIKMNDARQESRELTEQSTTLFHLLPSFQPLLFGWRLRDWNWWVEKRTETDRIETRSELVSSCLHLQYRLSSIEKIVNRLIAWNTLVVPVQLISQERNVPPFCHAVTPRAITSTPTHSIRIGTPAHKGWGLSIILWKSSLIAS